MKNLHKALIYSLAIHLLVIVVVFAAEVYENASFIGEAGEQMEALQTAGASAGSTWFYPAEEEMGWFRSFIVTIPATMGVYVWLKRLQQSRGDAR